MDPTGAGGLDQPNNDNPQISRLPTTKLVTVSAVLNNVFLVFFLKPSVCRLVCVLHSNGESVTVSVCVDNRISPQRLTSNSTFLGYEQLILADYLAKHTAFDTYKSTSQPATF